MPREAEVPIEVKGQQSKEYQGRCLVTGPIGAA